MFLEVCRLGIEGRKGNIKKIIGNNEDLHCNGRFCPRGTGGAGMYYDEDRLQTPLISAKNGVSRFQGSHLGRSL